MDAVDLYASNLWTGLALIPIRPNWPLRIAVVSMSAFGFSFALLLAARKFRPFREVPSGPPVSLA